jgi:hypothetical protein
VLDSYLKQEIEIESMATEGQYKAIQKFKKTIKEDRGNWSDFEKQLGIHTGEYGDSEVDDFCDCVKHFNEHLIEYLKTEENKIDYIFHNNNISNIFTKSISNFYNGLNSSAQSLFAGQVSTEKINNRNIQYNFISFNYTNVLDNCIDAIRITSKQHRCDIGRILHLHGDTIRNPLVGVDNQSQIINKNFSSDKKIARHIIKPHINDKLKNFNNRDATSLIQKSHIICLFGLSLGETDKTWWKIIGNWLKEHSERQLIIFNVVEPWNPIHSAEEIENIDKVVGKFCAAAGISEAAQAQIEDRIHIGLNTDLFKLDLTSVD